MIALLGLRFFDLDHQVRAPPDFRRGGQDDRAGFDILGVRERAAGARGGLDQDLVAGLAQRRRAAGNQAHPRFMIFHFFRNADNHRECSSSRWCRLAYHTPCNAGFASVGEALRFKAELHPRGEIR
jgi:hypothetical protein